MLLVCDCGGSEQLVRSALHSAGVGNWATAPLVRGKRRVLEWLDKLPEEIHNKPEIGGLYRLVKNNGRFAVILGYDDLSVRWGDVASGSLKEKLDAEVIASRYA